MTAWIVLTRNPRNNRLIALQRFDDEGEPQEIAEWPSITEAVKAAHQNKACQAWGHQIVEVGL